MSMMCRLKSNLLLNTPPIFEHVTEQQTAVFPHQAGTNNEYIWLNMLPKNTPEKSFVANKGALKSTSIFKVAMFYCFETFCCCSPTDGPRMIA